MLVLETADDYARFGLDRKALSDILTVGPGGLEVLARSSSSLHRTDGIETAAPKMEAPDLDDETALSGVAEEAEVVEGDSPEGEVDQAVEGGVEGGVAGGVPGGVAGGVIGGVASPEPVESVEIPPPPSPPAMAAPRPVAVEDARRLTEPEVAKESRVSPYTGRFAEVKQYLADGRIKPARTLAESWSTEEPGDVLALLALGEAWEAAGEKGAAARAYGSIIDLFPSRVDMRRLAGGRLERLGEAGLGLAIDTYRKAVADRPDHPSGHRLLAWALFRAGRLEEAFEALETGLEQQYPGGRFAGVDRVLREDLGLLAAAWLRAEPSRREEVLDRLQALGARIENEPSLRFVLSWETDANDVDLHVYDRLGGHAYYSAKNLPSGGELFADVTTGYGPECFAVRSPEEKKAAPYRIGVHYYSRGPMGYGMGLVQVVRYDGKGGVQVEPRPFVVMVDQAMVDVGSVEVR